MGVFRLEELEGDPRGKLATAHATAPMLNHLYGSNITYPPQLQVKAIGIPRGSFTEYLSDFEYSNLEKPNHNDPSKTDPSPYKIIFGNKD